MRINYINAYNERIFNNAKIKNLSYNNKFIYIH